MITDNDYKSIFKKIPSPIYLWQKVDADLILIDFNNAAKEITKIMVENMKANMENPNFWIEKERRMQRAADKVLKKREEIKKKER